MERVSSEFVSFQPPSLWVVRVEIDGRCAAIGSGKTPEEAEDAAFSRAQERLSQLEVKAAPSVRPVPAAAQACFDMAKNLSRGSHGYSPLPPEVPADPVHPESPEPPVDQADVAELIARTDVQMKRLNWDKKSGRAYLLGTFGVATRGELSPDQLRQFLRYLESQQQPLPFD